MNITKEPIGNLNEILKINLQPEDYKSKVDESVRKARKTVNMPGFRPGNVPESLVRKMYGKSILVDELNKIVSESLDTYIKDNKLDLLGHPLPYLKNNSKNNFDSPGDFEFQFEVGLSPEVNLKLPPDKTFPYYEIEIEEKQIQEQAISIRKQHGDYVNPEVSDKNSILHCEITEMDINDQPVEGGIKVTNTILVEKIQEEKSQEQFTGRKIGEVLMVDLVSTITDESELTYILNVPKEKLSEIKNRFEIKINRITNVISAELNQEFFDKAYGKDVVHNEQEFFDRIKSKFEKTYRDHSERKLAHDIQDELLHATKIDLPDSFLKRWLVENNENPVTAEDIEKEYRIYSREMKWKLIENEIAKQNNFKASDDEIRSYAQQFIINQLFKYGRYDFKEDAIHEMINKWLAKEENIRSAMHQVISGKVAAHLVAIAKRDLKKVNFEKFRDILHEHSHHH